MKRYLLSAFALVAFSILSVPVLTADESPPPGTSQFSSLEEHALSLLIK